MIWLLNCEQDDKIAVVEYCNPKPKNQLSDKRCKKK